MRYGVLNFSSVMIIPNLVKPAYCLHTIAKNVRIICVGVTNPKVEFSFVPTSNKSAQASKKPQPDSFFLSYGAAAQRGLLHPHS